MSPKVIQIYFQPSSLMFTSYPQLLLSNLFPSFQQCKICLKNVAHIHHGILCSNQKWWVCDVCRDMDESGEHHPQQTNTRTENQTLHVLSHRRVMNNENTWAQGREQHSQAYLPDSWEEQMKLCAWAKERVEQGGLFRSWNRGASRLNHGRRREYR